MIFKILFSLLLIFSLAANSLLVWYIIKLIKKIQFISSSIESLDLDLQTFQKHLEQIYGLEMFYGEPVIEGLIKHSKLLLESFKDVRNDYDLFNGDIDEEQYFQTEERSSAELPPGSNEREAK